MEAARAVEEVAYKMDNRVDPGKAERSKRWALEPELAEARGERTRGDVDDGVGAKVRSDCSWSGRTERERTGSAKVGEAHVVSRKWAAAAAAAAAAGARCSGQMRARRD